jgi:hypothetical protein
MGNPSPNRLLWKLIYTGTGGALDQEPQFWIVTQDEKWALSAFKAPSYATFATLIPFELELKRRNVTTPAQWVLRAVPEIGRVSEGQNFYADWKPATLPPAPQAYFRIFNPFHNLFLADEASMNSHRRFFRRPDADPHVYYAGVSKIENNSTFGEDRLEDRTLKKKVELIKMRRTILREGRAPDAAMAKAAGDAVERFESQCWLIRDWEPPRKRAFFKELADLDAWSAARRKQPSKKPPPS